MDGHHGLRPSPKVEGRQDSGHLEIYREPAELVMNNLFGRGNGKMYHAIAKIICNEDPGATPGAAL